MARLLRFRGAPNAARADIGRVQRPHRGVAGGALQREEGRHVGRPGEIQQARGRAVMLHQRQPLKIVIRVGRLRQKLVRLALEDAQNAALLLRPGARVDVEVAEIARERAVQRPRPRCDARGTPSWSTAQPVMIFRKSSQDSSRCCL